MKIKKFEIKAYRSCINSSIPLNNDLTALIGINGAGKSNLLHAILLLKKIASKQFQYLSKKEPGSNACQINVQIEVDEKIIYLKGMIAYETDEQNNDEIQFSNLRWNLKEVSKSRKWVNIPMEFLASQQARYYYVSKKRMYLTLGQGGVLMPDSTINDKHLSILYSVVNLFKNINYYSASQFSDPSKCPVSIELDENRPVRKFRSVGHEQFIMDLYKSYKLNDKQYKRYLSTINSNGIGLIDDILFNEVEIPSSSYEVKSGGKIRKIERNRTLIVPAFTIDKNILSPNQLSEGTFKTLALLFYILTDDSQILLIEEPEVCIHHGLLNSIIELIKTQSKAKQIIISTHSDYVLDHLSPENLVLVRKGTDGGTKSEILSKTMSKNDYKALKNYLNESGNLGEYWREGGFEYEES